MSCRPLGSYFTADSPNHGGVDPSASPEIINTGTSDTVLYTVSDAALLKNIGQYRAQGKDKSGKVVQLVQ